MDAVERQEHVVRFGEELRRIRREVGISMETLGNRAGLHRTEIGHLEHAGREPRLTTIIRVAHALDISACRLLEGVDRFDSDEHSEPQSTPLVAVRGPRRRPQGGAEASGCFGAFRHLPRPSRNRSCRRAPGAIGAGIGAVPRERPSAEPLR